MTESGARLDRVSIPYHVPNTGIEYDQIQHYPWMFVQDVAEHLFSSGEMWAARPSSGCPPRISMSQK